MKIVTNTIPLLSPFTGVGQYAYQIAHHLRQIDTKNTYTYYYGYYSQWLSSPGEKHLTFNKLKETIRKIPPLGNAARKLQDFLNHFSSQKFDLYFEPHFIPLNLPARRVVVSVLDFSFVHFPEWHPRDKVRYFQRYFWERIKRADHIIVISNFIKHEAIEFFGFPKDRITPIHLGIDQNLFRVYAQGELQSVRSHYRLPENFILFVGSLEPRKNLINLLTAYGNLPRSIRRNFKLVLVGHRGWENEQVLTLMGKLKDDVKYLGYVPEGKLGHLYNLANLFVYPSLYEGFGLPPLEAMASGCPVIVSQVASLPEVCGEAAFYINPQAVESICAGMERILTDNTLRDTLRTKGLERAALFSWEKSAQQHLRVFEATDSF